jgi:hypothetical protein
MFKVMVFIICYVLIVSSIIDDADDDDIVLFIIMGIIIAPVAVFYVFLLIVYRKHGPVKYSQMMIRFWQKRGDLYQTDLFLTYLRLSMFHFISGPNYMMLL